MAGQATRNVSRNPRHLGHVAAILLDYLEKQSVATVMMSATCLRKREVLVEGRGKGGDRGKERRRVMMSRDGQQGVQTTKTGTSVVIGTFGRV